MIHGGGHVMLSRKDIRPKQTRTLLDAGFLPISIDYRLCPETTLLDGPILDVCTAFQCAQITLPSLPLQRPDIHIDGTQVVAIGWSTGGHLAMTLAWTSLAAGIPPPSAILAFYCPTDYEDPFWQQPNTPRGAEASAETLAHDIREGVRDKPITTYNPPPTTRAPLGGWMAPQDPRSRIALYMNWKAQTLPVLLSGLKPRSPQYQGTSELLPQPSLDSIRAASPLAQIRSGVYRTPTFLIHGTRDDLIPWQQARRTHEALVAGGVESGLRIVEGGVHLFDVCRGFEEDGRARKAVGDGYEFLNRRVRVVG